MNKIEMIGYLDRCKKLGPPPEGYTHRYHKHDTGREYTIWAHLGDESLMVYRVWEWFSSRYEFNDKGKTHGFQVPSDGHPALAAWLDGIQFRYEAAVSEAQAARQFAIQQEAEKERAKVERFAAAFSKHVS